MYLWSKPQGLKYTYIPIIYCKSSQMHWIFIRTISTTFKAWTIFAFMLIWHRDLNPNFAWICPDYPKFSSYPIIICLLAGNLRTNSLSFMLLVDFKKVMTSSCSDPLPPTVINHHHFTIPSPLWSDDVIYGRPLDLSSLESLSILPCLQQD